MRHDDARPRKRRRPPLRRKTVRWSAKEVDALLAGVRVHGVGKWAAILRHSPVFNGVRTSVDLKDKWRNLTSPVRAAALNNRDHSSKSPHPLVAQVAPSADDLPHLNTTDSSAPDLSKPESDQQHPDTDQSLDNNNIDPHSHVLEHSSAEPILDSHQAQEAPMSPIHSQEDAQQDLDHRTHQDSSHPKSHSNSDLALFSPPSRDSNTVKPLRPDHPHLKSPAKLEPNFVHYPTRTSQSQPLHPPSESSVSPEVLSNPPQAPFQHSPHLILPQTHPQHPTHINQYIPFPQHSTSSQLSPTNLPNQHQVAAMHQFMNQSLYQSAAVLADYWRRIGHDPTAYGMPVQPGAPIPSHLYPYYAARTGSLYNSDDDDDDDDYDHITPILTPYPDPYSLLLKKPPAVPGARLPLSQCGLRDEAPHPSESRNPTGTANGEKVRKKPRTEQVASGCPGPGNDETKRSTTGAATPAVDQTPLTTSGGSASGAAPIVRERTENDTYRKPKENNSPSASDTVKKGKVEENKTALDTGTVSPGSGLVNRATVEVSSKPARKSDLKPVTEQAEFDSVADDVGYFPDEDFSPKSQQHGSDQDKDDNGEREVTEEGPIGMAPLSFPGLGVEEQRQFSVTDLV